jgi:hypothetical protein
MIQIIAKPDEILNNILNMNWLYHFSYNWKFSFMWFHKKHLDKFFIQTNINVLKNYFHLKDDKNYVIKSKFYMFIKMLDEIRKNLPQKYT